MCYDLICVLMSHDSEMQVDETVSSGKNGAGMAL